MLQPKRTKYRRPHIIKYEGHCKSAPKVAFGEFGLQALEGAWVTTRQIEALGSQLVKSKRPVSASLVIPKEVVKSGSESSHI